MAVAVGSAPDGAADAEPAGPPPALGAFTARAGRVPQLPGGGSPSAAASYGSPAPAPDFQESMSDFQESAPDAQKADASKASAGKPDDARITTDFVSDDI